MTHHVQYWFSTASPRAWLGSQRFAQLAADSGIEVEVLPVDLGPVFSATGGIPFSRRSAARQSCRQLELARWSKRLDVPLNLEPRFYPVDRGASSRLLIAARNENLDALALSHCVLRAIWAEERDISDWDTLEEVARVAGHDGAALVRLAKEPATEQLYRQDTVRAVDSQVFGSPTFVVGGERFWGQDRLDFLIERLSNYGLLSA